MDKENPLIFELAKDIVMVLAMLLMLILIVIPPVYLGMKYSCSKKANLMGLEYSYGFWTSCMVKIDGKFQPFNEYNTVNLK